MNREDDIIESEEGFTAITPIGEEIGTFETEEEAEEAEASHQRGDQQVNRGPEPGEKVNLDRIEKRGRNKFVVVAESGREMGTYRSRAAAEQRLAQIEQHKNMKADSVRRFDFCAAIHTDPTRTDGVRAHVDESTGFLKADVALTRTGVFQYQDGRGNTWGELRTEREVFDAESMRSFEQVPVTDDHPSGFVTTENYEGLAKGSVGSIRRKGDKLVGTLLVMDAELIRKIQDGKQEVSCGYEVNARPKRGVHDGIEHTFEQTRIRGNHLAVVQAGRAGSECRINLDSGDAALIEEKNMKTIHIDGADYQVPSEVADLVESLRADMKGMEKDKKGKDMEEEEEEDMKGKKADEADARFDMLKAEFDAQKTEFEAYKAGEAARIDARAAVVASAKEVAPKFDASGKTDTEIRVAVIEAVQPDVAKNLEGRSDDYIQACYDAALQLHQDRIDHDPSAKIAGGLNPEKGQARQDTLAHQAARAHLKLMEG